jgi:chromosome segregation ATPase
MKMSGDLNIENKCNQILQSLKSSCLNYSAQVTPFSMYVTVRKSLVKQPINHHYEETNDVVEEKMDHIRELQVLKSRCKFLESSNEDLKASFEQEINEHENKISEIERLEKCLEEYCTEVNDLAETKSQTLSEQDALIKDNKTLLAEMMKKDKIIDSLKSVNKKLEEEHEISDDNHKATAKILKTKDKELYNMRKENETLTENLDRAVVELKELKNKVTKENKENQRKEKAQAKKDTLNNLKESKPSDLDCKMCDEKLESKVKLKLHIRAVHLKDEMSQTNEVVKESKLVQTLKMSQSTVQDRSTVQTQTDAADVDGIMEMSKEYEKYSCFYCEKEIKSEVLLEEHRITCHGATDNPSLFSFPVRSVPHLFKCGICGLVGICKEDIINHKKSVHENQC